ncbi:uncharacterized protein LOC119687656 [Teleopsis dalmanni]|uniref:uncharacterized protein LOC119687656 n=1 Tax=Teleopsis dalmanni TaxID=139649 RepID=UPI0018CE136B|nr:uncharacterized protein LOC119687656 [Teleopsis dalmanni]
MSSEGAKENLTENIEVGMERTSESNHVLEEIKVEVPGSQIDPQPIQALKRAANQLDSLEEISVSDRPLKCFKKDEEEFEPPILEQISTEPLSSSSSSYVHFCGAKVSSTREYNTNYTNICNNCFEELWPILLDLERCLPVFDDDQNQLLADVSEVEGPSASTDKPMVSATLVPSIPGLKISTNAIAPLQYIRVIDEHDNESSGEDEHIDVPATAYKRTVSGTLIPSTVDLKNSSNLIPGMSYIRVIDVNPNDSSGEDEYDNALVSTDKLLDSSTFVPLIPGQMKSSNLMPSNQNAHSVIGVNPYQSSDKVKVGDPIASIDKPMVSATLMKSKVGIKKLSTLMPPKQHIEKVIDVHFNKSSDKVKVGDTIASTDKPTSSARIISSVLASEEQSMVINPQELPTYSPRNRDVEAVNQNLLRDSVNNHENIGMPNLAVQPLTDEKATAAKRGRKKTIKKDVKDPDRKSKSQVYLKLLRAHSEEFAKNMEMIISDPLMDENRCKNYIIEELVSPYAFHIMNDIVVEQLEPSEQNSVSEENATKEAQEKFLNYLGLKKSSDVTVAKRKSNRKKGPSSSHVTEKYEMMSVMKELYNDKTLRQKRITINRKTDINEAREPPTKMRKLAVNGKRKENKAPFNKSDEINNDKFKENVLVPVDNMPSVHVKKWNTYGVAMQLLNIWLRKGDAKYIINAIEFCISADNRIDRALAFASLLVLSAHNYIQLDKQMNTNDIGYIRRGPKFLN